MKIISKGKPVSQIIAVRADSKKALILKATLKGVTTEDIMKLTGWPRSAASSATATEIMALGAAASRKPVIVCMEGSGNPHHSLHIRGLATWFRHCRSASFL